MAKTAALIPELEDIIRHHSREKRTETLSRLTTLFVAGSSRFNEDHIALFDDVLGRLITDVEPRGALRVVMPPCLARQRAHRGIAQARAR